MGDIKLEYGKFYHIYNRGNNFENIFTCEEDYLKFLHNMDIYLKPVAEVIAWVLLKNHFHFMVYIKKENEIGFLDSKKSKSTNLTKKWSTHFTNNGNQELLVKPTPIEMFKHFFNSYARWFNTKHERIGSLLIKNYEKIHINNSKYYKNLIVYIHNNPVKHGFVNHPIEYPWSSHLENKNNKENDFSNSHFNTYFKNQKEFKSYHKYSDESIENPIKSFIIE
jgi:REP element-mobilizing transposase RayT